MSRAKGQATDAAELTRRYLELLGVPADATPDLELLRLIHRRHQALFVYTNLDIVMGSEPSVEPLACVRRIIDEGRAGYCFQQNGALEVVLSTLGYRVGRRYACDWKGQRPEAPTELSHLALTVSGLPTPTHPGGQWWVDVGLGEGFLDPLPLRTGQYADGALRFWLTVDHERRWSLLNDPGGSFTGMEIWDRECDQAAVDEGHARLSATPDGRFAHFLVVERRTPEGVDTLRGCVLSHRDGPRSSSVELTDYDRWRVALDEIGLSVRGYDEVGLRTLFDRSLASHQEWVASGRP